MESSTKSQSNGQSKTSWKSLFTFYNYTRFNVAILTFVGYAIIHANRKSFSNVKVLVTQEWSPSTFNATSERQREPYEIYGKRQFFSAAKDPACKAFLGVLDTVFMVSYALSVYFGGTLGDRVNPRYLLCSTMVATSVTVTCFLCVSEWIGVYSMPWYIIFWIFNALVQGPIFPCCMAIMGNWFGKAGRGLIFGLWCGNASSGNVIGALIIAQLVGYGYDIAALIPAILPAAMAIIIFFGLVSHPSELGMKRADDESETEAAKKKQQEEELPKDNINMKKMATNEQGASVVKVDIVDAPPDDEEAKKAVGFIKALCVPGVIVYSIAIAGLKLVNYAFFFWLPYYMNGRFHWSQEDADSLATWYDVGGIAGGVIIGMLSDRFNRPAVLFVNIFLSLPTIVIYNFLPDDKVVNAVILFIIGFFVFGLANILSTAVAADLSQDPTLRGSKSALATVSGIIVGTGTGAAALGQIAIPLMEEALGWDSVFYMLLACLCVTTLGVGRMLYLELLKKKCCLQGCACLYPDDDDDNNGTSGAADETQTTAL